MRMKYKIMLGLLCVLLVLIFGLATSQTDTKAANDRKQIYTCPMHPTVVQDHPGNCPVCGMKLVRKKQAEVISEKEMGEMRKVVLSPTQQLLANVATELVTRRSLSRKIHTVGKIDYDETRLVHVAARFGGRVEKLYVDFTGKEIKEGEPLLEIYSPELVSAQQEFLLALKAHEKLKEGSVKEPIQNAKSLLESSREKLLLWGITEEQIEEMERTKRVKTHMIIYSPASGTVIKKTATEGMYVKEGRSLYDIADLRNVWMYADLYESEISGVNLGQPVEVRTNAYPDRIFTGKINFIDPVLNPTTRTVKLRADFPNPQKMLKPEMYVEATIESQQKKNSLAIPAAAVINTGHRVVVWVEKEPGVFVPRDVKLGERIGDLYVILDGLQEGEMVVSQGGFLIDSEAQLKAARSSPHAEHGTTDKPAKIPEMGEMEEHRHTASEEKEEISTGKQIEKVTIYTCPMHPEVITDEPGKCSICEMNLVKKEITKKDLDRLIYFCPMHPEIRSEKPGRCPICEMYLEKLEKNE